MRVSHLFVICFVGFVWCGTNPSNPIQLVIIDTNAWSEPLNLFDRIIQGHHQQHPSEPKLTYRDVWRRFGSESTIDSVIKSFKDAGILTDKLVKDFNRGILFTKRIIDFQKNRQQVEIDVPIFVYNELTKGLSSKIRSPQSSPGHSRNYQEFFDMMPIRTHVAVGDLTEGVDYPHKRPGITDTNVLKIGLKKFFEDNGINGDAGVASNHQSVNRLIEKLGQDYDNDAKKKLTRQHLKN